MKKEWSFALAGLLLVFGLSGCASSNGTGQTNHNGAHTQAAQPQRSTNSLAHGFQTYTKGINEHNYRNGFTANGYNQHVAELLVRAANDVPGVVRASAVVKGSDAIVGIVVRSNLQAEQVKVIKSQVRSQTRQMAPRVNVRVTSDPKQFQQLRDMNAMIYQEATRRQNSARVDDGHPHSSVGNAFSQMLKQLSDGLNPAVPKE
mgnify:CR=1 FL=1|jgi:YhcN/YlaJ family sporulation lipoprotein